MSAGSSAGRDATPVVPDRAGRASVISPAERARAAALLERLAPGATRAEAPILLPAGPLLDLYGEDIRLRAFTTDDPLRGEAMLRPDFTVPLAQAHMERGAGAARYVYAGEVFRRQEADAAQPREYLQVGLESLGAPDPAAADADVFAALAGALAPWDAAAEAGDLGLLIAAVEALDTTPARRAALRRHVWRPRRFRRLMDRFTGRAPRALPDPASDAPLLGLRGAGEIAARHAALREDAAAPPIPAAQAQAVEALLDLAAPMPEALAALRCLAAPLPGLQGALGRAERRAAALAARGVDVAALPFAPAKGRSAMEYYDGFTFTWRLQGAVVATGGRYDALTARLGGGRGVPAVGGVVRPGRLGDGG